MNQEETNQTTQEPENGNKILASPETIQPMRR